MRVLTVAVALLVLPAFLASGADKVKTGAKVPAQPSPPPKPEIRNLQVKSGPVLFGIRLEPGVPDPEEVVEVAIDMAEVPPIPDPIYGERIPVKGAEIVAEVADADGAGYTVKYRVHPMQDAGSYGFHFTPLRKDNYQVTLKGIYKTKKFDPSFRVPVGIWPFTKVDEKGTVSRVPTQPATSRMPAVPSGAKGPAVPGGPAPKRSVPGRRMSPLRSVMTTLGESWARAGEALLTGRRPDLKEARVSSAQMKAAAQEALEVKSSDSEFKSLISELNQELDRFEQAAGSGKAPATIKAFKHVGSHHCNRCHFKMRWKMIDDLNTFPAALP
jgi:hypothetical protein